MDPSNITFVVLTKNESRNLGCCLESLPSRAAAIVYDAQSSDDTATIASRLGARVVVAPWRGFSEARQTAASLVRTSWTFMIDADERLSPELAAELADLKAPADVVAFSVPRRTRFCGRWVRSAGWWPDRLIRLFRPGRVSLAARGHGSAQSIHEHWVAAGPVGELRHPLDHDSYPTIASYRTKFARYTSLEARGRSASLGAAIAATAVVPVRATWFLLGRGGLLDGWQGVYVSIGGALYPAAVAFKALQRHAEPA